MTNPAIRADALRSPPKGRAGRALAGIVLTATVAGVLFAWLQPSQSHPVAVLDSAFCVLAPAEAHAGPADRADVNLNATVPLATPPVGLMAATGVSAAKGDVVRVTVTSPRDGGIAVHGLLDVRPISAGARVTVEFRAIYSGRFPVHFHGADGSHFEVSAIEVLPSLVSSAK